MHVLEHITLGVYEHTCSKQGEGVLWTPPPPSHHQHSYIVYHNIRENESILPPLLNTHTCTFQFAIIKYMYVYM